MIDEKVLIERLELLKENCAKIMGNNKYLNKTLTIRMLDMLIEEIKIIGEQQDGMEWFSVKDGNPKFYGKYLTVCKGVGIPQIRLYKGTWDSLTEVTHWMELPKMPNNR